MPRSVIEIKESVGFTLIEVAIVLAIMGFLLAALISPMGVQRESSKRKEAEQEIKAIEEALYGFAIANDRLPCPSTGTSAGVASPVAAGACTVAIGFVPASTLGIQGRVNCENLLIDPWNNPYRYSVTTGSGSAFTTGISTAGPISGLNPDLEVCTDTACTVLTTLTNSAVAVIYSMGRGWSALGGVDETENAETTTLSGGCVPANYAVSNDVSYVSHGIVETGNAFNDIVSWISPNILYAKLLAAGVL